VRAFSPDHDSLSAAVELLGRLVAFNTVSTRSNIALIEAVATYLRAQGVDAVRIDGPDGDKAGLIASIGPAVPGGVVLSGHTDVVPVAGQAWSSDPFVLVERNGLLYGRGTADMKGYLATVLASVPLFAGAPLRVPIHLALSHDEEVGCLGAPRLIEALLARAPRPAAVFVGEPTGLQVANRHRGISTFMTAISGRGGHSSVPGRGVNAIGLAARFIAELEEVGRQLSIGRSETGNGAPEYTTINIGRIEGGTAVNMIAEHCQLTWECRPEGEAVAADIAATVEGRFETLLRSLRRMAPEVAARTDLLVSVPPLVVMTDSPAVSLALRLTGRNVCIAAPFASEAGLFQQAGVPAVVCGPGRASEAHQPDEFIAREQLSDCLILMQRLAEWASQPART
jgi:acetylornithine deacetylase